MNREFDIAVVGGGILGLAHAYEARQRGLSVALFERNPRPQGASVRNFGIIWQLGQAAGTGRELAALETGEDVAREHGLAAARPADQHRERLALLDTAQQQQARARATALRTKNMILREFKISSMGQANLSSDLALRLLV